MSHNLIYIINNKLHNNKYKLYTILFYVVIMHSYYCLYINLHNNNYISIFIYFALLLLFYIKFKKFSYIISYIYLLFTVYFIKANVKENLTLRERVQARRNNTEADLKNNTPEPNNAITPCEEYIMNRITTQVGLNITPPANTARPGTISTSITTATPPPALDTQLFE